MAAALLVSACATPVLSPDLPPHPAPPTALQGRLAELARGFDGQVGIAVEDARDRWIAAFDGRRLYPQQSVAKLWTALAVFDAVDRGALTLNQPVIVHASDMSVFNQPMQKLLVDGAYATTVDGLLVWSIAQSDNAANDILVGLAKGPSAVRAVARAKHLGAIRAGELERVLEARIAGVAWKPEYSFGQAFWDARDKIPVPVRAAKLDAYVAHPQDGAAPAALVDGLARLQRGELLSAASTARFLAIMASTQTGPLRLKAGLAEGWTIAHKTGTGQDLADLTTGYNDVGLITAPDGRIYAVAVMIAATRRPIPDRQTLMADVARAVVAAHDAETAPTAGLNAAPETRPADASGPSSPP